MIAFIGVEEQKTPAKSGQGIGEYCKGKDIEECRGYFGEGLARACSTCPD